MAEIKGHECSVTALAHAIDEDPEQVYRSMKRDMSVQIRGKKAAYVPDEIGYFLFLRRRRHLIVNFFDQDGVEATRLGIPQPEEVLRWARDHRPFMAAFVYGNKGHWVGFDGFMVNNLRVWGVEDGSLGWDDFVTRFEITEDLMGRANGCTIFAQMAVLID